MYSECLKLIDLYSKICLFDVSPVINYNFYAFIFLSEHMSTDLSGRDHVHLCMCLHTFWVKNALV